MREWTRFPNSTNPAQPKRPACPTWLTFDSPKLTRHTAKAWNFGNNLEVYFNAKGVGTQGPEFQLASIRLLVTRLQNSGWEDLKAELHFIARQSTTHVPDILTAHSLSTSCFVVCADSGIAWMCAGWPCRTCFEVSKVEYAIIPTIHRCIPLIRDLLKQDPNRNAGCRVRNFEISFAFRAHKAKSAWLGRRLMPDPRVEVESGSSESDIMGKSS